MSTESNSDKVIQNPEDPSGELSSESLQGEEKLSNNSGEFITSDSSPPHARTVESGPGTGSQVSVSDGVKLGLGGCVIVPSIVVLTIVVLIAGIVGYVRLDRYLKIEECKGNGGWFCEQRF